jgi:hypothetical protein
MNASDLARILDRELSLQALSEEHAPGLLGSDVEIHSVRIFGSGDSVLPRPDVFTIALEDDVAAARGLARHWSGPFYAPGLAPSTRAMHLRKLLASAGYVRPRVYLPRDLGEWVKLVTYVPESHGDALVEALAASGAGAFDRYDGCSFRVKGIGAFRPLPGAAPFLGEVGKPQRVDEWRIECTVAVRSVNDALGALYEKHPYEEPAWDLYPLVSNPLPCGVGLTVDLADGQVALLVAALKKWGADENALHFSLEGDAAELTLIHAPFGEMLPPADEGEARWVGGKGDSTQAREVHVDRAFQRVLDAHIREILAPLVAAGQLREVVGHAG